MLYILYMHRAHRAGIALGPHVMAFPHKTFCTWSNLYSFGQHFISMSHPLANHHGDDKWVNVIDSLEQTARDTRGKTEIVRAQ